MTNEKIKSLEERVKQIRTLMNLMDSANKTDTNQLAIYHQTLTLYEQNDVIIDYLQEIYKNQLEVKK